MKTLPSFIAALGLLGTSSALAQPDSPRGNDILPLASNCGIGPIPQTAKAGHYNDLCTTMTDSEKCLALVKASLKENYELEAARDQEKARYCLELFTSRLLGD